MLEIHPDTAARIGLREGEPVWIETPQGRIRQKARITEDISPRVVGADYAWWFPEKGPKGLYDWSTANVNLLTDDGPGYGREMGTPRLRGLPCRLRRVPENSA